MKALAARNLQACGLWITGLGLLVLVPDVLVLRRVGGGLIAVAAFPALLAAAVSLAGLWLIRGLFASCAVAATVPGAIVLLMQRARARGLLRRRAGQRCRKCPVDDGDRTVHGSRPLPGPAGRADRACHPGGHRPFCCRRAGCRRRRAGQRAAMGRPDRTGEWGHAGPSPGRASLIGGAMIVAAVMGHAAWALRRPEAEAA